MRSRRCMSNVAFQCLWTHWANDTFNEELICSTHSLRWAEMIHCAPWCPCLFAASRSATSSFGERVGCRQPRAAQASFGGLVSVWHKSGSSQGLCKKSLCFSGECFVKAWQIAWCHTGTKPSSTPNYTFQKTWLDFVLTEFPDHSTRIRISYPSNFAFRCVAMSSLQLCGHPPWGWTPRIWLYRREIPALYYLFSRCVTPSSCIVSAELLLFKEKLNHGV